jgi:hypothetical protein
MDTVALVTSDFPVLRREQMWNAMQRLVLNGLSSPHTRRAYSQALEVFVIWLCSEPGGVSPAPIATDIAAYRSGEAQKLPVGNLVAPSVRHGYWWLGLLASALGKTDPFVLV